MAYDIFFIVFCFFASFSLRYDELFPSIFGQKYFWKALAISSVVQFTCFYFAGMYRVIWRFSGLLDLLKIFRGVGTAILLNVLVLFLVTRLENLPRSIFFIDAFLLIACLGGGRFFYRIIADRRRLFHSDKSQFTKVIVVGAGRGGEGILREIKNNPEFKLNVVGLVDDDPSKQGKTLHSTKVLGRIKDIAKLAEKTSAQKILIAITSATRQQMKDIINACRQTSLEIRTLPKPNAIFYDSVGLAQLRALTLEDLLGREPIQLDVSKMRSMIGEKTVLVTGAGGSIGSELCFQILRLGPKRLILFELTELFLYQLEKKLKNLEEVAFQIIPIIGDVRDKNALEKTFLQYRPDIVFHAAAYKHVPMMEMNPREAIKTNIFGSKNVAELALKHKAEKFVLISTDKAVNPTNVMGTSKRIAEMICQSLDGVGLTKFISLRFGNVLGSSGSVVPLFREQIQKGGPITVTHPEIKRYFMSIPEACQLIIQAGSFGKGREIFILDMGAPVYIKDLAKEMIKLAGTEEKIEIIYTGLRPGEKLYEEMASGKEQLLPTVHSKVKVIKTNEIPPNFHTLLQELENEVSLLDTIELRSFLKKLVPEYEMISEEVDHQNNSMH